MRGRATAPLRQDSLALSARAVTMVMAARSDVPVGRRHFQVVVVFVYSRLGNYSFANLNLSEWGKCGPQARLVVLLSCNGHSKSRSIALQCLPGRCS